MNLAVEMHINMSKLCFKEIFFWQQIYKLDAEKPKEHSGDCWDTVSKREDREADKKGRDISEEILVGICQLLWKKESSRI